MTFSVEGQHTAGAIICKSDQIRKGERDHFRHRNLLHISTRLTEERRLTEASRKKDSLLVMWPIWLEFKTKCLGLFGTGGNGPHKRYSEMLVLRTQEVPSKEPDSRQWQKWVQGGNGL